MRWLAAILLLATFLGGCTEAPEAMETPDGQDPEAPEDTPAGNGTDAPVDTPLNNTAPAANITVDVANGTAPLAINVTLDGSDADGDDLTWTLQLDGNETANGTSLPATLAFILEAGNWTFVLNLTDGNLTTQANVTISVVAAPTGPCGEQPRCIVWEDDEMELWSDGICEAKEEVGHGAAGWAYVPWTNIAGQHLPDGLWVYEETNARAGLQLHKDEGGTRSECVDGDMIVF